MIQFLATPISMSLGGYMMRVFLASSVAAVLARADERNKCQRDLDALVAKAVEKQLKTASSSQASTKNTIKRT